MLKVTTENMLLKYSPTSKEDFYMHITLDNFLWFDWTNKFNLSVNTAKSMARSH